MVSNCPACGAPLNLDGSSKQTTCPFCGNVFKVNNESVQPVLSAASGGGPKPDTTSYEPPSAEPAIPSYEPPGAEPPVIDTDPLYNPPIGTGSSQSSYGSSSSAPRIPFPQQTYNTARQTAQNAYSTIAARGKNFLIMALVAMVALIGGCCACLILTIRWISGAG